MRDIVAMILAGGRVFELSVLTSIRTKAAVPFGGQYRIIDFALSSLMRSDIERVGVLSLYRPSSLIAHLGIGEPWDMVGRGRGVKILPPYLAEGDHDPNQWYRGTADAVYKNLSYIKDHNPRDVLILSGDHIYSMDFRPFIRQHRESDADLSMVVKPLPTGFGRGRFGFAEVDENLRVRGYQEKPDQPRSNLASLTIYLFKTDVLVERLEENRRAGSSYQLYSEVLPEMVKRDRVFAHKYYDYWNYARSIDSFWQANMDLLGENPLIDLEKWGIRSRVLLCGLGDLPPTHFIEDCRCTNSLICQGARVAGQVDNSVIGPGVVVEAGARVTSSVLMNNVMVEAEAIVDRAVLDKQVTVGRRARVGHGDKTPLNREMPEAFASGISVIGKNTRIPEGVTIGRNCAVYPELKLPAWPATVLKSGECLGRPEGSTA